MAGGRERIETRLFVEADLAEGAIVGLDHARAHFLRSVLRLSRGARVAVFNGRHGEWLARIEGLAKGWASLLVESQRRSQEAGRPHIHALASIYREQTNYCAD